MSEIENWEPIKKYICAEIMKFKPDPANTRHDHLSQFHDFIIQLLFNGSHGIIHLCQYAIEKKQKLNEYEQAVKELKDKIPDIKDFN